MNSQLLYRLRIVLLVAFWNLPSLAQELYAEFPVGGGNIVIVNPSNMERTTGSLDFLSPNEGLIPVEGGSIDASAEPFVFFIDNSTRQVIYANLGTAVTFPAHSYTSLTVGAEGGAEVIAHRGLGSTPVPVAVFEQPSTCAAVPEPSTELLGILALLGALWIRRWATAHEKGRTIINRTAFE